MDGRTTRHAGYLSSQRIRKRVEEIFGWVKTVAGGRKLRYRRVERNRLRWELTAVAYNLVRMAKLALTAPTKSELCPSENWTSTLVPRPKNESGTMKIGQEILKKGYNESR